MNVMDTFERKAGTDARGRMCSGAALCPARFNHQDSIADFLPLARAAILAPDD
jgi:hypothetical protein